MRNNPAYKDEKIDFDRYLAYMHGQIKELVTGYGFYGSIFPMTI